MARRLLAPAGALLLCVAVAWRRPASTRRHPGRHHLANLQPPGDSCRRLRGGTMIRSCDFSKGEVWGWGPQMTDRRARDGDPMLTFFVKFY